MAESKFSEDTISKVGIILNDQSTGMAERFRALFTLRNIMGATAIKEISRCFTDPSALLKHECAYCLGQIQDTSAVPILINVLEDLSQEAIVRHEAAEALGALSSTTTHDIVIPVLQKYTTDAAGMVADTCCIALDLIEWKQVYNTELLMSPFNSFDPAPPFEQGNLSCWSNDYLNSSLSLFHRYRAMFSLRNINSTEAVEVLLKGFMDSNPLFKHEVAFVLGQLEHPAAVATLKSKLEDVTENHVVRHECADALGSIGHEEYREVIQRFISDPEPVVSESCIVAMDMFSYKTSDEFQYADGVSRVE
ncbi:deoxyhypusine hydroxylase-like [Dysidea avara]|uniref:deoxyhypusine hydroxylase-like n=1 Tax=Dysidea avara TaxID=196820 RepID=UPI00332947E4